MGTTRVSRVIAAPRAEVFAALVSGDAVQQWMVPDGMTSQVHVFDARVGGELRITLTYRGDGVGKTGAKTDTSHGRFVDIVPNERVVQVVEFESEDAAMQGENRITYTLSDVDGGTEVVGLHEGLPDGVSLADNEDGWRMSLDKLARFVTSTGSRADR